MPSSAAPSPKPATAAPRRGGFFRDPDTGEVVVVQAPNVPLWVFLVATAVRLAVHPTGGWGTALSVASGVSLAVWSVLEIAKGASPFRRVLGAVVLAGFVAGLVMRVS